MNFDFIESGTLDPGSNFITRAAPGIGNNGGGARCHSLWRRYSERVYNALKVSSGEGRFMTILSNKDLYEKVRRTILALQNSGMEQEAARLENAMKISSMPGEILGEIRLVLERIDTSVLAEQITFEIGSEIAYINSVLG